MPAPHYSRRAFLAIALGGLAAGPAWASGPVAITLTKSKVGSGHRVKIYAKLSFGAISVGNQYIGFIDVPNGGSSTKSFKKNIQGAALELYVTAQHAQNIQIKIMSKLHGVTQTIIRNLQA